MLRDIKLNYFKNNEEKLKTAGITRITDITDLDRVGIPVFSAIRPRAQEGAVSVYAGKGAEKKQAEASAMMEGFERYSAEMQESDKEKIIVSSIVFLQMEYSIHIFLQIKVQPHYLEEIPMVLHQVMS